MGLDYHVYIILGVIEPATFRVARTKQVPTTFRACPRGHRDNRHQPFCGTCGGTVSNQTTSVAQAEHIHDVYPHDNAWESTPGGSAHTVVLGAKVRDFDPKVDTGVWPLDPAAHMDAAKAFLTSIGLGHLTPTLHVISDIR